jgi:hypothetical protein
MSLVLASCAGQEPASTGGGDGGGVDTGCRPEAETLIWSLGCCGGVQVVADAQGPVVFFGVEAAEGPMGDPGGVYAARPGQARVRVIPEIPNGLVVAPVALPGHGGGFLLCYVTANFHNGVPSQGCMTVGPDLHPASAFDPQLGNVVYLARLDGQLYALHDANPPSTTMGPVPELLPIDETGAPGGTPMTVDCPLAFGPVLPPAVASSGTRLACVSQPPRACGGEIGATDCSWIINVYDRSGLVFSLPDRIPLGGYTINPLTLAVRNDEVLAVWVDESSTTRAAPHVLPLAADGTPGEEVVLPVALGPVVATRDGYTMVARGFPGADEAAALAIPTPVAATLRPDGRLQAGPVRLIDLDPGVDEIASPFLPLVTAASQLAVAWDQNVGMNSSYTTRLIFRQVPGDLSGLTPAGSDLPSLACDALAPAQAQAGAAP